MRGVWVTRAEPGATATAGRLRALGHEPLVAPLIAVRPVEGGPIDLAGVAALAFTSANGLAVFAARAARRDLPVFAVGAATAAAARAAGFDNVRAGDGDVGALAPVIAGAGPFPGEVLHPGPEAVAGDLVGDLIARGVPARRAVIYRSVDTAPSAAAIAAVGGLGGVLLHSPLAARALAAHLQAFPAPHLTAFVLSPNVAAPLEGVALAAVRIAAAPTEAALLELLGGPAGPA